MTSRSAQNPVTLAVSAEMVFVGLPFAERVRRIHGLGFEVEIWDWTSTTSTSSSLCATKGSRTRR